MIGLILLKLVGFSDLPGNFETGWVLRLARCCRIQLGLEFGQVMSKRAEFYDLPGNVETGWD